MTNFPLVGLIKGLAYFLYPASLLLLPSHLLDTPLPLLLQMTLTSTDQPSKKDQVRRELRLHAAKSFKRLVLDPLHPLVRPAQELLQFAYQEKIGVDNAIIFLLHHAHSHLDNPGGSIRITFFDFSSAFNTIHPALLGSKLPAMQVHAP